MADVRQGPIVRHNLPRLNMRIELWKHNSEMCKRRDDVERSLRRFKPSQRIFSRFEKSIAKFIGLLSVVRVADGPPGMQ